MGELNASNHRSNHDTWIVVCRDHIVVGTLCCGYINLSSNPSHGFRVTHDVYLPLASLVAQMVKNPPEIWETCIRSLGWEDSLEEGMAIHSSILAWRIPMDRGAWQATVNQVAKSQT